MKNDWGNSLDRHHFYFLLVRIVMGSKRVYAGSNLFVTYTNDDYTIDDLLESCKLAYKGMINDILRKGGPLRDLVVECGFHEEDVWVKEIKKNPEKHEELYLLVRGERRDDEGGYFFTLLSIWPDTGDDNISYQKYHIHFNEIQGCCGHALLKHPLMERIRNRVYRDRSKKLKRI